MTQTLVRTPVQTDQLYIGLMSGTSLDGVDGVLVDFGPSSGQSVIKVLGHVAKPFSDALKQTLLALNTPDTNELHRAALAANALVRVYADVVQALLNAASLNCHHIIAIGAHGQTVRHRPGEFDGDPATGRRAVGYTLQINNPALLAELTGIDVVADFRSRDVAAGGQGAPLVPAFHREVFGKAAQTVQVLNLGGIANITVIPPIATPNLPVIGFDCGPGNALMDAWCQRHTGQPFDAGGTWAAVGQVNPSLLAKLMDEPYLYKVPPKSTGRDLFNGPWLDNQLKDFAHLAPVDIQATLTEYTATTCSSVISSYQNKSEITTKSPLIVCGGGALNGHLMQRLQAQLPEFSVESSAAHGLPALEVEAAAFAWLARKAVLRQPASLTAVTGADAARVLGALYPA